MEGFFEWMLESSLLVAMVLCIRGIFTGRIRYAAVYALWLLVLLRFIIPVNFIPAPVNIGNIFYDAIRSGFAEGGSGYDSGDAGALPQGVIAEGMKEGGSDIYSSDIPPENEKNHAAGAVYAGNRRGIAGQITVCAVISVSVLFLLCVTASNIRMLTGLKRRRMLYGKRNGVNIYTVYGMDSPCLYGFLKPAIYIPAELVSSDDKEQMTGRMKVSDDELEQIITHEYVHYMHKDHIWAVFRIILLSVYWFHPFLWVAAIYSKKDAELFCDETVVGRIGEDNRICYGEMLVRLAKDVRWTDFRYSMTPMSRRGKEMEQRIRAISRRRRYSAGLIVPLVLAAVLSLGLTCGTGVMKTKDGGFKLGAVMRELLPHTAVPDIGAVNAESANTGIPNTRYADASHMITEKQGLSETQTLSAYSGEENLTVDAGPLSDNYEQAFSNYINIFTEAVNTGNTDNLDKVLVVGSDVYEQQCAIAVNYYNRGIREEVKSFSIVSAQNISEMKVEIISKEKIKVYYADETVKTVKQEYKYTCENIAGSWIITGMSDTDDVTFDFTESIEA